MWIARVRAEYVMGNKDIGLAKAQFKYLFGYGFGAVVPIYEHKVEDWFIHYHIAALALVECAFALYHRHGIGAAGDIAEVGIGNFGGNKGRGGCPAMYAYLKGALNARGL
jgi:hypothetical protein